jgi:DNA-binding response OmpR family regulator
MHILIADDEQRIRRLVCDFLKRDGHVMLEAGDGQEAVQLFDENQNQLDLVILDVMMPFFDGWAVLRHIKEKSPKTAVMMLTARSEDMDQVLGFDLGADDYVSKPFSPMVLAARVRAMEKRLTQSEAGNKAETIGTLSIDEASRSVQVAGSNIELTPKEYELLIYLKNNKNIALSRESILNAVWGYDYFGDVRSVDTHIKKLRAKLGEVEGKRIETVRGYGYRFEG